MTQDYISPPDDYIIPPLDRIQPGIMELDGEIVYQKAQSQTGLPGLSAALLQNYPGILAKKSILLNLEIFYQHQLKAS